MAVRGTIGDHSVQIPALQPYISSVSDNNGPPSQKHQYSLFKVMISKPT